MHNLDFPLETKKSFIGIFYKEVFQIKGKTNRVF